MEPRRLYATFKTSLRRQVSELLHIRDFHLRSSVSLPEIASAVDPVNKRRDSQVGCWLNGSWWNIPEAPHCAKEEEEGGGRKRKREG